MTPLKYTLPPTLAKHIFLPSLYLRTCNLKKKLILNIFSLGFKPDPQQWRLSVLLLHWPLNHDNCFSAATNYIFFSGKITIPKTSFNPVSEPLTQKLGKRCMSGRPANCTSNEHFKLTLPLVLYPPILAKNLVPLRRTILVKSVSLYEGRGLRRHCTIFYLFFLLSRNPKTRCWMKR